MSYTWENGEVITAEKLNSTGNRYYFLHPVYGIGHNGENTQELTGIQESYNDITNAIDSGLIIVLKYEEFDNSAPDPADYWQTSRYLFLEKICYDNPAYSPYYVIFGNGDIELYSSSETNPMVKDISEGDK